MTEWFVPLIAGLFGLTIGSFLNVCTLRWPKEESVVSPGSRCPKCQEAIRWYDNIPVLSWIVLRGRCRRCSEPVSIQYPLVELALHLPSATDRERRELGVLLGASGRFDEGAVVLDGSMDERDRDAAARLRSRLN